MNCTLQYDDSGSSSFSTDGDGSSRVSSGTLDSSNIDAALLAAYSVEEWMHNATGMSFGDEDYESYSSSRDFSDIERDDDDVRKSARKKDILTELASASSSSLETCATDPSSQQIYDIESLREDRTVESESNDDETTTDASEEDVAKDRIVSAKKKDQKFDHPRRLKMKGRSIGSRGHHGSPMETISVTESKGKRSLRWIPIKIRRSFRRQSERTDIAVLSNPAENRDDLVGNENSGDANSDDANPEVANPEVANSEDASPIPEEIEERDGNHELGPEGSIDDGSARELQTRQKSEVDSYSMIPNLSLPEKCKTPESTDDFFSTQGFELSLGNGIPGSSENRIVKKKHSLRPWKKKKAKAAKGPVPVYEASTATENAAAAIDESSSASEQRNEEIEEVSVSTSGKNDSNDDLLREEYPSALAIVRQNITRKASHIPDPTSKNGHQSHCDSATEESSKASTQETNQGISEDEGETRPAMESTDNQKAQSASKIKEDHGLFRFMPFGSHSSKSKPPTGRNQRAATAGRKKDFNNAPANDPLIREEVNTRQAPVQSTYFFDPEEESVSEQEDTAEATANDVERGNRKISLENQGHETRQEQSSEEKENSPAIIAPILATIGAAVVAASLNNEEVESSDGQSSTSETPNNSSQERVQAEDKKIQKESSFFGIKRNRVFRRKSKSLGIEESPVKEKRRFSFASRVRKDKNVGKSTIPTAPVAEPPAEEIPRKRSSDSESDGVGEILDGPLASPYLLQLWDGSCSPNRATVHEEEPVIPADTNTKEKKAVAKESENTTDKSDGSEGRKSFSSGLAFGADTILLGSLLPSEMRATKKKSDETTRRRDQPILESAQPLHSKQSSSKPIPVMKKQNRTNAKDTSDLQNIVHKIKKLKEIREDDSLERQESDVANDEPREPISFRVRRSMRSNSIRLVDQTRPARGSRNVEQRGDNEDWYDDLMPRENKKSREERPSQKRLHLGVRKGKQRTLADQVMLAKQSDMPNHRRSRSRSNSGEQDEDWYKDFLPWTWSA